jgi:hypothetical protein
MTERVVFSQSNLAILLDLFGFVAMRHCRQTRSLVNVRGTRLSVPP